METSLENENIVDVTSDTFEQLVIQESNSRPVAVDFWAPWCGPCRALTPILEKVAKEYEGKFLLAKINSDENQDLSAKFGIRGIPNVKVFENGAITDEFSGALPEGQIRQFLDRIIPSEAQKLHREALVLINESKFKEAIEVLKNAQDKDISDDAIRLSHVEALIKLSKVSEAATLFSELKPLSKMEDLAQKLKAILDLASSAEEPDNINSSQETLANNIKDNPGDLTSRYQYAQLLASKQDYAAALSELLEIIKRNKNFQDQAARKLMVEIFKILGDEDKLTGTYRRQLASALN